MDSIEAIAVFDNDGGNAEMLENFQNNHNGEPVSPDSVLISENKTQDGDDVWGMPKYEQHDDLANLTDEQYLARVRNRKSRGKEMVFDRA